MVAARLCKEGGDDMNPRNPANWPLYWERLKWGYRLGKRLGDKLLNWIGYYKLASEIRNAWPPTWNAPMMDWPLPEEEVLDRIVKDARMHFLKKGPVKYPKRDPLVLDLDGDGIRTTKLNEDRVTQFDMNSDGFAEMTGWADAHDGVLAMDRNGNGLIDDGGELFGDQTILRNGNRAANGFQALAELDSNRDGKIDANDPAFSQLRILTLDLPPDYVPLVKLEV
jgi:hypothetical protein